MNLENLYNDIRLIKRDVVISQQYELGAFCRDIERRYELGFGLSDIINGRTLNNDNVLIYDTIKSDMMNKFEVIKDFFDKYDIQKIRNEKINFLLNKS